MPTNEERKEAAARLREIDGKAYWKSIGGAISELEKALGYGYAHLPYRLADLIEPEERTCQPVEPFDKETKHVVERGQNHYYWPYLGCPECQFDFPQGSKFCPNCGARVKEETDAAE